MAESLRSVGDGVEEVDDAVRRERVRGEGGGDQCDFASAKVGARCDSGAGETGESILSTGALACRAPATGFRFRVVTVGTERYLSGLVWLISISKALLFQAAIES